MDSYTFSLFNSSVLDRLEQWAAWAENQLAEQKKAKDEHNNA